MPLDGVKSLYDLLKSRFLDTTPALPSAPPLPTAQPAASASDPGMFRALAEVQRRLPIAQGVGVKGADLGDGVVGGVQGRTVLLNPAETQKIPSQAELEAAIVHELSHIRDNFGGSSNLGDGPGLYTGAEAVADSEKYRNRGYYADRAESDADQAAVNYLRGEQRSVPAPRIDFLSRLVQRKEARK